MPKKSEKVTPEMDALFEARIARIYEALGMTHRTQVNLAVALDIRQSSISDAKRRASLPSDWVLRLYMNNGIRPEFILDGSLPMSKYAFPGNDLSVPAILKPHLAGVHRALEGCFMEIEKACDAINNVCKQED